MPRVNDSRIAPPSASPTGAFQVSAGVAALRAAPAPDAEMTSQALHGQTLRLYEERDGFGLVRMDFDGYVGWADMAALSAPVVAPTHRVTAARTYVFSEPDLKSAPRFLVSLNGLVAAEGADGAFTRCARAGWVFTGHLAPIDAVGSDPAAIALHYLGAPYLWGGKESLGLDCTGLTQMAYAACGLILPRDSDMQFAWPGRMIDDWQQPGALQRNDIVFWKGHCGLMLDAETLLHSNAHHMACAQEPLRGAIDRIARLYGEPIGAKRIDLSADRLVDRPDWLCGADAAYSPSSSAAVSSSD